MNKLYQYVNIPLLLQILVFSELTEDK